MPRKTDDPDLSRTALPPRLPRVEFPPETGRMSQATFADLWDSYCERRRRTWPTLSSTSVTDRKAMLSWATFLARHCPRKGTALGPDWIKALYEAGTGIRYFQPFAMPQRLPSTMTGVPADDEIDMPCIERALPFVGKSGGRARELADKLRQSIEQIPAREPQTRAKPVGDLVGRYVEGQWRTFKVPAGAEAAE